MAVSLRNPVYTQYEHNWVLINPASQGRRFLKLRDGIANQRAAQRRVRRATRQSAYPHNEQIEYSMHLVASLGNRTTKSSQLPTVICNAALPWKVWPTSPLGFPCRCI